MLAGAVSVLDLVVDRPLLLMGSSTVIDHHIGLLLAAAAGFSQLFSP